MANYQAISQKVYAQKRWQRPLNYAFAAEDSLAPLVLAELPKAILAMPVAFVQQGDDFVLNGVLSLRPGLNAFVARDLHWAGAYIPAVFRSYPFRLIPAADGKQVLCFDEESGLLDTGPKGDAFFNGEGQPAPRLQDTLDFLVQLQRNHSLTVAACAVLKKHKLIRPWTIPVKTETGERQATGLFQVDECALNQLSGAALLDVRDAGALLVAFCQLLSQQHLPRLGQMTEAHAKAAAQAKSAQSLVLDSELNLEFFNNGGTISFAGLI